MNKIFYKQNIIKDCPEKWVPTGEVVLTNLKTADGICQCKHDAPNAEEIEGDNFIEYNKFGIFKGAHLIESGYRLFWCSPIKEATGYFPKLKYGNELFSRCDKLEKINAPYFPLLEDGTNTFFFTSALKNIGTALSNSLPEVIEFPELVKAENMFSTSGIEEIQIKCPKLKHARNMFAACKLSADSIKYFADNVGVWSQIVNNDGSIANSNVITFGTKFAPGEDVSALNDIRETLISKQWNPTFQYNGDGASTINLDDMQRTSANLIYAKIEPSENGLYITSSGEQVSFTWAHEISNPSDATWKIFSSVEEAKEAFGITEVED